MSKRGKETQSDSAHLEAALGYLKRGWAVVPAGERAKRPIIRWQRFQHEMPTEEQLTGWYKRVKLISFSLHCTIQVLMMNG